jgi:Domain of unknown function (DUF4082)/Bacterial Ig-like domain/Bacterial Ig domain
MGQVMVLMTVLAALPVPASAAGPCDPPVANPIVCENSKPGNPPSEWTDVGDPAIAGFATDISVDQGQTVHFKISTRSSAYRIDIFRVGYYGGAGARKVATVRPSVSLPQSQPACLSEPATGLVDCGNWAESASWAVPADATSGVYRAVLNREDTPGDNHIFFVVRDDDGRSDMLVQTSDTTYHAYNRYGGNSLYSGEPAGRAYKASYNRPFEGLPRHDDFLNAEYPLVRWLEANGYDVSYFAGVDTDRRGSELLEHRVFVSSGHDEYWSGTQRRNVEAALAAGVNLAFFSGNEVFWKTRWETSIDGSGTPHRTLVSYKETKAGAKIDPSPEWTGTWRDPRLSPPSDGGRPENALTGQLFTVNAYREDAITVPEPLGKMRLWRDTSVADLQPGGVATLPTGTLGYEWDEEVDNGHRPPGLIRLSETTVDLVGEYHLKDQGNTYSSGTATHRMTLYRHASGALVFGAGTVQWAWGLDANHLFEGPPTDPRMQQATINLLADMGVQPDTLQPGLVRATASTDATAPTAAVTSPTATTEVRVGTAVTVAGTAADSGGGVVGGVEVSVDGGTTWHPATGREQWTYAWTPAEPGPVTIAARAVDDSGNLQSPSSTAITVLPRQCPCSIWPDTTTPAVASVTDTAPLELGVKFRTDADGVVSGVRFYKGPGNSGTHVGNLWSATGQRLATATFMNETPTGWQTVSFATPIEVTANTTYVASYHAPAGGYAASSDFFTASGVTNAPLRALQTGVDGVNGVYRGGASGFPTESYRATNYWVDVVFTSDTGPDTKAPKVVASSPPDGTGSVDPATLVTAGFSEAVDPVTIAFTAADPAGAPVTAQVRYDASTRTATLDPDQPLAGGTTYTVVLRGAADAAGNVMAPTQWTFTTAAPRGEPGVCPCLLWSDSTLPAVASVGDTGGVELGVKFRSDLDGYITGVRFYKGSRNGGTHVGNLWTAGGTQLASAVFANETATGWQTVTFDTAIPITAGTTYVASYHAPAGGYAADKGYFATSGADYGPLHALPAGADGPNGVFREGGSAFPTDSFGSTNYWVDVVFERSVVDTKPPTVTRQGPAPNAPGAAVATTVTATFSEPVDPASVAIELRDPTGAAVAGSVSYEAASRTSTFKPTTRLNGATTYSATVRSATDRAGNLLPAPVTWSFTTGGSGACPCTLYDDAAVPSVAAVADASAIELGVRFTTDVDGWVSGVRFYKGAGNTGAHTGSLWTASGQRLALATFTNETATGWQTVRFDAPVAVTAGTTYVASYHTPTGHYAADSNYFGLSSTDKAPLHAPATGVDGGNGVYRYGGGGFPSGTHRSTNYWVDVIFETAFVDAQPPSVVGHAPAAGVAGVALGANVTATFGEPVDPASIRFKLRDPAGVVLPATVSYAATGRTATLDPASKLRSATMYTATVTGATDAGGHVMTQQTSWSFTTGLPKTCPCSLWDAANTPAVPAVADNAAVELGVRFSSDADGWVSGVRFYKGAGNDGIHTGSLWSAPVSAWRPPRSRTRPPAAGRRSCSTGRWRSAPTPSTSRPTTPPRAATRRTSATSSTPTTAARRCTHRPGTMGSSATVRGASPPTPAGRVTTGSTSSSTRPTATPAHPRCCRPRPRAVRAASPSRCSQRPPSASRSTADRFASSCATAPARSCPARWATSLGRPAQPSPPRPS